MLPDRLNVAQASQAKGGINPVNAVSPVLATASLGSTSQELASKVAQLVKMQAYSGQVISKVSGNDFLVNVSGNPVKDLMLKMELPPQTQVGKALTLQYLNNDSAITFMLKGQAGDGDAQVKLSQTGHLVGQFIQKAQEQGVPKQYQAQQVVSQFPFQPKLMAQDLRQALVQSGLFYESHLQEYSQGQKTLQQIRLEPQNQQSTVMQHLVYQQLSALENQRLSWYGEVWPQQMMSWEVHQRDQNTQQQDAEETLDDEKGATIVSELTLDLPTLGKVHAKLSFLNGRLSVHIAGNNAETVTEMRQAQALLADGLTKNGQLLDGLNIAKEGA